MPIRCPRCSRELAAADVNLAEALGRCTACNIVFRCGTGGAYAKPEVPMPKGFQLSQDGVDFVLVRRWFSAKAFALLAFCAFWDGFLAIWYYVAFTKNGPLVAKLFPLIHVSVGVVLTYVAATMFVNRTTIRVSPQDVDVRHGPLPWPGNISLSRHELQQLFCEEKVGRTKNGVSYQYTVHAVKRDGSRVKLVADLDAPEQALFIEQRLERQLGIADRPVAGEMRPLA